MSQPHPPIPEPQPQRHGAPDDDPRTQSILLPPSQRPTAQPDVPAPADGPATQAAPDWTAPAQPPPGQPGTAQFAAPAPTPAPPAYGSGATDVVPGFPDRPAAPASGSSAATPSPSPGPTTAPDAPSATHRRSPFGAAPHAGRSRAVLLALGLAVAALVLLEIGLVLDYGNQSLWEVVPTWSAFATLAALVVLVAPLAALSGRLSGRTAWRVGAVGVGALAVSWVLVALPLAASDRGFWLTAALGAAGAALWLTPGRAE
jgi:hypothetical protein